MADPLSISASIAGLVTLADSIFRGAFHYAKSVKGAKREVTDLAKEAQNLAGVLHQLSLVASALELDSFESTLRLHHVISCRQLLLRVEKAIAKSKADLESSRKRDVIQRHLKWPFSATEMKELLAEITRHKETLTLALSADSVDALSRCLAREEDIDGRLTTIAINVKETLEISTHIRLNDERRRVLDFFMSINPQQSLDICSELRHPLTGLWLIDGDAFQQWLITPSSKLWLVGIPGAGKTVLAGAMIEEVLKKSSEGIGVAFFFCEYKDSQTHQPLQIMSTMASQLARQNVEAYKALEAYFKELHPNNRLGSGLTLSRMSEVLHRMADCFQTVYMIIDGLDECGDRAQDVANAFLSITETEETTISLSILSRNEQPIRDVLQDSFTHLEIEAQRDDVRLYVATEIESRIQSKKLRLRNMALKDEILHALVDENGGMYVGCRPPTYIESN